MPLGELRSGAHDASILAWLATAPSGWQVLLTFWHEPNSELRAGSFTASDYVAAHQRVTQLVRSQQWEGTVKTVACYSAYQVDQVDVWSDTWVPAASMVDILTWDVYGNPRGGTGLDGVYPAPALDLNPCLRVTERLGFGTRWGVTEHNTPRRNWDPEETGTNWDQRFSTDLMRDWWESVVTS